MNTRIHLGMIFIICREFKNFTVATMTWLTAMQYLYKTIYLFSLTLDISVYFPCYGFSLGTTVSSLNKTDCHHGLKFNPRTDKKYKLALHMPKNITCSQCVFIRQYICFP
jgi:hypothetical protein